MSWLIAEPNVGLGVHAESDGIWFRSQSGNLDIHQLRSHSPCTRLGRLLPTLVPQLLESGIAVLENGGIRISYQGFAEIETHHEIDAFDSMVPWAPFSIELETSGWPGGETFRYFYRFYSGTQVVHLERLGCFVRRSDSIYRLDSQTFSLVEAIDSFNALSPHAKANGEAFIKFASIKHLAGEVGAQLDEFLGRERVIVPSKVGLDLIVEADGRITFAPKIDGAPEGAMREAFLASDDIEEVYSLDDSKRGRVRVVLDETQREVLQRMQRIRHLGGAERAKVLREPHRVFDGIAGAVEINLGPRVTGVGDFPFVAQPYLQRSSMGIFNDCESAENSHGQTKFNAGVRCRYADGTIEAVQFTSRIQLIRLREEAEIAFKTGQGTVDFHGKSILVDTDFLRGLGEAVDRVTLPSSSRKSKTITPRKYLLIYTNENELEYDEPLQAEREVPRGDLPLSLKANSLYAHQAAGFSWLQRTFQSKRHGCLLADDMGLGKTLQVLTFLAWFIERGDTAIGSSNPEAAPWDPILIILPLTLLENETWIKDMRQYFAGEGEIFKPWVSLYGKELRNFRREAVQGQETLIGESVLDIDRLRQYRIVLTNYETVVNYQHSFAKMKEHWSVIVTDEAQEYKTPSTRVSHALKSLSPRFRIASTGTPVETRLLDLWNIFDFLQPGHLLESAAAFRDKYEKPMGGKEDSVAALSLLKDRLELNRPTTFVLRREKNRLPNLPTKYEHVISCPLSSKQRDWHLDIVSRVTAGGEDNHSLKLLQLLLKVYEHPALVPSYEGIVPANAIEQCPKLAEVVECLRKIRNLGEKALIFTRRLNMQQILAAVIGTEFNLEVDIINGATPRHGDTKSAIRTRKSMVEKFQQSNGFNVIVLSPDVAGVGLTLVEANHVIHYGRWWNPAKEAQATDRVYRIGQKRDVHVYYPIAKDPQGTFETFDEKLDALIQRRRKLASDFLSPLPSEEELEKELLSSILATPAFHVSAGPITEHEVRSLSWSRFEALTALLEKKRGARVILTPSGGDDKADVLSIINGQIRLIQCKHRTSGRIIDADVLAEVIGAIDLYRSRYLRNVPLTTLVPVVVTNGSFTRQARNEADTRDVQLIGDLDLWRLLEETPCTPAEVEAMEGQRLASMRDVLAAIRLLVI